MDSTLLTKGSLHAGPLVPARYRPWTSFLYGHFIIRITVVNSSAVVYFSQRQASLLAGSDWEMAHAR
jgi:hypothetical protein